MIFGFHQPGKNGVLVAPVAALANTLEMGILPGKVADDLPGGVFGAIVHEQDMALGADLSGAFQLPEFIEKHSAGQGEHLLLVVAGNDDG